MQIHWSRNNPRITRPTPRALCTLAVLMLGGVAACETVSSPEMAPSANVAQGGAIGGRVLNLDGLPVPGAVVRTHGGAETVTDPAGNFRLSGLAATPRLAVSVEAPGYDGTTAIFRVRAGALLERPITIQPLAPAVTLSAGAGGSVPIAGGGQVVIPANAFAGVSPGDPVTVRATYIDTQNPAQFSTAPGDFAGTDLAGNPVRLESFGMISVAATGPSGQAVDLAPGQTATIEFPLRGGTAVPTRAVWTFDPVQGTWVEETTAVVTPTTINVTVPTLAPRRNVDTPFPPVCIAVRVLRSDNVTPRVNEYVAANGISYAGFTQDWTNTSGVVQLQVPASSQTVVKTGGLVQTVTAPPAGSIGCPIVASFAF
ncbi:MAG TPA: carboxypeptidase-like regulatory domain-containing protein [Longimicrobium sp.]|nr:carboxypeptidase-like regulatory domain-containing protein [Longimicrobium sp.]